MDKSPGVPGRRTIEQVIQGKLANDKALFDIDVENRVANLERRGGGMAVYEIKIFEDINTVFVGDGIFWWPIPAELDGAEIIKVETGVSTVSSSGPVQVQLRHFQGGVTSDAGDILTNKVTILAGAANDDDTATITGGFREVADGDWIRCDIDAAGTGAKGLALMVTCTPSPLGSVTLQGAKGDPGGVTQWTGAYSAVTNYITNQSVSYNGTSYVSILPSTGITPGVTPGWETYWMILSSAQSITSIVAYMTGGGAALDVGVQVFTPIYFDGTIVEATLLADKAGSVVVDIWQDTYGNYPPTAADSICGSNKLTLSSAIKTTNTSLTGWTLGLVSGSVLYYNFDSVSTITKLAVGLKVRRT